MKISYSITARGKGEHIPISLYLKVFFPEISLDQVESIFGFVEPCTMYGGRTFHNIQVSERDLKWINDHGKGIRIPMTNHFINRKEYESYRWLLEKYHKKPNSIITVSSNLAKWIKEDFPEYEMEASIIKNITDHDRLDKAFELYDVVVLPMTCNNDLKFLKSIEEKDRIRLFANAGCALTCPARICYRSVSVINKKKGGRFKCSKDIKYRQRLGRVKFLLDPLIDMGFNKFKLVKPLSKDFPFQIYEPGVGLMKPQFSVLNRLRQQ